MGKANPFNPRRPPRLAEVETADLRKILTLCYELDATERRRNPRSTQSSPVRREALAIERLVYKCLQVSIPGTGGRS